MARRRSCALFHVPARRVTSMACFACGITAGTGLHTRRSQSILVEEASRIGLSDGRVEALRPVISALGSHGPGAWTPPGPSHREQAEQTPRAAALLQRRCSTAKRTQRVRQGRHSLAATSVQLGGHYGATTLRLRCSCATTALSCTDCGRSLPSSS